MTEGLENVRQTILATVKDLATDFLYYDRKEDESLPVGAIERAVSDGVITVDEIVSEFRKELGLDEGP